MSITHAYAAGITKAERDEHGDLIVYGKATGPDVDLDAQICDPAWLRSAMPEWMKFGNLREMHQPVAAGVGLELANEGDDWFVKSQVVDEGTAKKIEAGALKGYSVGIKNAKVVKDAGAPGGRIVGGTVVEVSYVDRPCNPTATLAIAKAASADDTAALEPVEADADTWRDEAKAVVSKAVNPDGTINEAPDIEGGRQAIALVAQLIKAEADELAAGELDESCDISLLVNAVECLKCWLRREEASDAGVEPEVVYIGLAAKLGYTPAQVDALPDELKSALAVLAARDVSAEREPDTTKTTEPDLTKFVSKDEVTDLVKAAVTEATKDAEERSKALAAELAKVKATPIPGGPVVTATRPQQAAQSTNLDKALYYERMADQVTGDPVAAAGYRKKAAELRRTGTN